MSPSPEAGKDSRAQNQRATIRYRCPRASAGRVYLAEDLAFVRAWLHDLSTTGIGLILGKPLSEGLLLTVHLKSASGKNSFHIDAHVIHSTRQAGEDWLIGCQFVTPLSDEDVQELL